MSRSINTRKEWNILADETAVVEDIRYFESRLEALGEPVSARDSAAIQVYRLLLRQRRQLLAAIRDGVPEKWPEYGME
jgi:hypothetical protein